VGPFDSPPAATAPKHVALAKQPQHRDERGTELGRGRDCLPRRRLAERFARAGDGCAGSRRAVPAAQIERRATQSQPALCPIQDARGHGSGPGGVPCRTASARRSRCCWTGRSSWPFPASSRCCTSTDATEIPKFRITPVWSCSG